MIEYLHSAEQINKLIRAECRRFGELQGCVWQLLPGNGRGCIPAAAGLGKGRLLTDKACLLTDQRWARAAVELSLEILCALCPGLLLQEKYTEGYRKGEEFERNGGSLQLEVGRDNFWRSFLAPVFDGLLNCWKIAIRAILLICSAASHSIPKMCTCVYPAYME